jgi:hypothetical protein
MVRAVQSANRQWNQLMQNNPLLAFILMFELISFREKVNALKTPQELASEGREAFLDLSLISCSILQDKALFWLTQTEKSLNQLETPASVLKI